MDTVAAQAFLFAVTATAAYRVWRLIGYDDVSAAARYRWLPEGSWSEALVECPWCLGSWVAFAAVALADLATSVWLPAAQGLAAAVAVGAIHGWVEP